MRDRILCFLRARALKALSDRDYKTWRRCADLLDRNAKRKLDAHTAQNQEVANVG